MRLTSLNRASARSNARESANPCVRTLDGLPLFLTATALTASLIPYPSMWQVVGLGALWFLTLFGGKRPTRNRIERSETADVLNVGHPQ